MHSKRVVIHFYSKGVDQSIPTGFIHPHINGISRRQTTRLRSQILSVRTTTMLKYATFSIILRIGGKVAIPGHGSSAILRPRLVVQVQPLLREAVKGRVVPSNVGAGSDFRSGRGLGFHCLRGRGRLRLLRGRGSLRLLRGRGSLRLLRDRGRLRLLRGWGSLRLLRLRGRGGLGGLRLALLSVLGGVMMMV